MAVIQFVRNFEDLSTDKGYQFKFHCDKCGNGYMTSFQTSIIGTAGGLLRAAGDLFGGFLGNAGNSAYDIQKAIGGQAHDSAFSTAVQEGKQQFKQCSRCGKWVCPEICWNHQSNLCHDCAPDLQEEMAAAAAQAKAEAARQQLYEKARTTDYTSGVDMSANSAVSAPAAKFCANCGVSVGAAKFCPDCGTAVKATKPKCGKCGHEPAPGTKFCPECGNKI